MGEFGHVRRTTRWRSRIFSIGVVQNNNDCECSSIWGILEVIAAIGLFLLTAFLLFKCISAYCTKRRQMREEKQKNMVELLDRSWTEREIANNKNTAIDMLTQADRKCSREHLHMPARLSERGETNQEMGQEIGPFQ